MTSLTKKIAGLRDKAIERLVLEPFENILARMSRVEDLMLSGMSDADARRCVSEDWAKGVRRWKPIEHDIEKVRAIRPDIAEVMEKDERDRRRKQRTTRKKKPQSNE